MEIQLSSCEMAVKEQHNSELRLLIVGSIFLCISPPWEFWLQGLIWIEFFHKNELLDERISTRDIPYEEHTSALL